MYKPEERFVEVTTDNDTHIKYIDLETGETFQSELPRPQPSKLAFDFSLAVSADKKEILSLFLPTKLTYDLL